LSQHTSAILISRPFSELQQSRKSGALTQKCPMEDITTK
jgi:hypothetical protein